jgi:hypothetical protein
LEKGEDLGGLGAVAVVGAEVGMQDRAVAVDDVGGGKGERPFVRRCVAGGEVEADILVECPQFRREGVDDAEGAADFLAVVGEDREFERVLFRGRGGVVGLLGADGNQRRAGGGELGQDRLVGLQLQVAVGAPAAAVERRRGRVPATLRCRSVRRADRGG